jgi:hypothetical protein
MKRDEEAGYKTQDSRHKCKTQETGISIFIYKKITGLVKIGAI